MVLYRILGVTLYDDDSLGSPMVADVSTEMAEIREASALTKLRQSQMQSCFEGGERALLGEVGGQELLLEELKLN
jgi:hypothetical protein